MVVVIANDETRLNKARTAWKTLRLKSPSASMVPGESNPNALTTFASSYAQLRSGCGKKPIGPARLTASMASADRFLT